MYNYLDHNKRSGRPVVDGPGYTGKGVTSVTVVKVNDGQVVEEQRSKTASFSFESGQGASVGPRLGTKRHGRGTSITKGRFGFKRRPVMDGPGYKGKGITSVTAVKVNGNVGVTAILTRDSQVVQEWVEEKEEKSLLGLDLEWQPNFRKGQKENKVSRLQISTETECLLVQMLLLDCIPPALVAFLKDPNRKFAGVGIGGDAKKLQKDHGLVIAGEIELTGLAVDHYKR